MFRVSKYTFRFVKFNQFAHIHEAGVVCRALGLLHIVRHDNNGKVFSQLQDQLLDFGGADRVERRAGLIHQDYLGFYRDSAGYAEPLLLPARKSKRTTVEATAQFVPEVTILQGRFHSGAEFAIASGNTIDLQAVGYIAENGFGEWVWPLEYHADFAPDRHRIGPAVEYALTVQGDITRKFGRRCEVVHAVHGSQQRGFATSGWADKCNDRFFGYGEVDTFQDFLVAEAQPQVVHGYFYGLHGQWVLMARPNRARMMNAMILRITINNTSTSAVP